MSQLSYPVKGILFRTLFLFALMDWIADKREFNGTHPQ